MGAALRRYLFGMLISIVCLGFIQVVFRLQIKMGSRTMIVLSSPAAIKQVVDKHGWMGSSRPTNYIAELCGTGGEFNILFTPDCECGPDMQTLADLQLSYRPTHDPLAPSPGTVFFTTKCAPIYPYSGRRKHAPST
jgi:hypothetical protein